MGENSKLFAEVQCMEEKNKILQATNSELKESNINFKSLFDRANNDNQSLDTKLNEKYTENSSLKSKLNNMEMTVLNLGTQLNEEKVSSEKQNKELTEALKSKDDETRILQLEIDNLQGKIKENTKLLVKLQNLECHLHQVDTEKNNIQSDLVETRAEVTSLQSQLNEQ